MNEFKAIQLEEPEERDHGMDEKLFSVLTGVQTTLAGLTEAVRSLDSKLSNVASGQQNHGDRLRVLESEFATLRHDLRAAVALGSEHAKQIRVIEDAQLTAKTGMTVLWAIVTVVGVPGIAAIGHYLLNFKPR